MKKKFHLAILIKIGENIMASSNVSNLKRISDLENTVRTQSEAIEKLLESLSLNKETNDITTNGNEVEDIRLDKMIPVISLIPYELSMMQLSNGKAKYKFNFFGEKKLILYQEVINLIEMYRHFIEAGYFYIDNVDVVKRHGLSEIYAGILTKIKIEEIVECKTLNSVTLYSFANTGQRNVINEFIIGKIRDSKEDVKKLFDMNFIRDISDIAGFDIIKRGLEARANLALMEEPVKPDK
jgi:hypothetical protein